MWWFSETYGGSCDSAHAMASDWRTAVTGDGTGVGVGVGAGAGRRQALTPWDRR